MVVVKTCLCAAALYMCYFVLNSLPYCNSGSNPGLVLRFFITTAVAQAAVVAKVSEVYTTR